MQDFGAQQKAVVNVKLEVIVPSSMKPDGAEYNHLRIAGMDGSTKLDKKVEVGHMVESHIGPGTKGDFYFVKLGRLGNICL